MGVELTPPVTFRLRAGSGPVYISGQHVSRKRWGCDPLPIATPTPATPSPIATPPPRPLFPPLPPIVVPDLSWEEEEEEEEEAEEEEEEETPEVPPRGQVAKKGHAAKVPHHDPALSPPTAPLSMGGVLTALPPHLFLPPPTEEATGEGG